MQASTTFRVILDMGERGGAELRFDIGGGPDQAKRFPDGGRFYTVPLNDSKQAGDLLRGLASLMARMEAEALAELAKAVTIVDGQPVAGVKRRRRRRSAPAAESGEASPQLAPVPVKASA